MTIVYTVGTGSKHDDVELRWSLRSVALNGRGVDRVVVVGHVPEFVNRDAVTCLDMDDPTKAKHFNIFAKAKRACDELKMDGEFLVSSDDHIYTGITDFASYPRLYQGDAKGRKDFPPDKKFNAWWTALVDTRGLLDKCGLPHYNMRGHFNTYFDSKYMDALECMMTSTPAPDIGFEASLIMGNLKMYHEPHLRCRLVKMSDCKLDKLANADELADKVATRSVISIGDGVFDCPGFTEKMDKMFPEKCRYEKG